MVECAPATGLPAATRAAMLRDAVALCVAERYLCAGTVEFLVDKAGRHYFIEVCRGPFVVVPIRESPRITDVRCNLRCTHARVRARQVNPRVQVEHTVTEEVTGVDIVQAQFRLAAGHSLADLGLGDQSTVPCLGHAVQCRVTTEV